VETVLLNCVVNLSPPSPGPRPPTLRPAYLLSSLAMLACTSSVSSAAVKRSGSIPIGNAATLAAVTAGGR
jgi:hypothetical protein